MKKMRNLVDDLQKVAQDPSRIMKFFSMQQPSDQRSTVVWKLQINLRDDHAQQLLDMLVNSTLWMLMGATRKTHSPAPSSLSRQISNCLGKGRGKGKSKNTSKPNKQS